MILLFVGIKKFEYDLKLADVSIGQASLEQATHINGGDTGLLEVPITFRPKEFGGALWDIVRGKGTGYAMVGSVEVDTPFGPMHLPFNKTSETRLKGKGQEVGFCFSVSPFLLVHVLTIHVQVGRAFVYSTTFPPKTLQGCNTSLYGNPGTGKRVTYSWFISDARLLKTLDNCMGCCLWQCKVTFKH